MRPKVLRNFDENESTQIDTIMAEDRPAQGQTLCATIGLSEHINWKGKLNSKVHVEFCIVGSGNSETLPLIVASSAFYVMKDRWFASPDVIFPDLFDLIELDTPMQHIMFVSPIVCTDQLKSMVYDGKTIAWLQLIPISSAEYKYALEQGIDALQEKLAASNTNYTNLQRACSFSA